MVKRIICGTFCLLFVLPLGGCWSYRSISEVTPAVGVAIDKDEKTGNYLVSFEIIDLTKPSKDTGVETKVVESEGKTIFEAVRAAKRKLSSRLFFGTTEVIIVNKKIAQEEGVRPVIDFFIRDAECRETSCLMISQQDTAKEIFSTKGIDGAIAAQNLNNIIENDNKITSSTVCRELYMAWDIIESEGISLALPAIHIIKNDEEPVPEANGIAVFNQDKMIGFLSPEETRYFLFATDKVSGGILTVSSKGADKADTSLEIQESKTKCSFSEENGQLKLTIKTDTKVFWAEIHPEMNLLDKKTIKKAEEEAGKLIQTGITDVIRKTQTELGSDIFGFGQTVYKTDFKRWKRIKNSWEELFLTLRVEVQSNVKIVNSALMQKS